MVGDTQSSFYRKCESIQERTCDGVQVSMVETILLRCPRASGNLTLVIYVAGEVQRPWSKSRFNPAKNKSAAFDACA
jgi:hypothetical protein